MIVYGLQEILILQHHGLKQEDGGFVVAQMRGNACLQSFEVCKGAFFCGLKTESFFSGRQSGRMSAGSVCAVEVVDRADAQPALHGKTV